MRPDCFPGPLVSLGNSGTLNYVPAYAQGIVILGAENTTTIRAMKVGDGAELWSANVGSTAGRYPVITDNFAIYAGQSRVVAVNATSGEVFWQVNATTAAAPVAVFGNRVYFLEQGGTLRAQDLRTGANMWSAPNVATDGASLIATEDYVFVAVPEAGILASLSAQTGQLAWSQPIILPGAFSSSNALALGAGRLIVFRSDDGDGNAAVSAFDPRTGALLWEVTEPGEGLQYGFLANGNIYYYHQDKTRIRARDVTTGALVWSIPRFGVKALTAAQDSLIALTNGDIEIYRFSPEAYLAQMASGLGQTTLLALSNVGSEDASATVEFFNGEGQGLTVPVEGIGSVNHLVVTIPAGTSKRVQINQVSTGVVTGWIRVTANQTIRASSIYQFSEDGEITNEAGVGDASATGSGNVLVTVDQAGFNTGIAIANPTDGEANITLTLLDAQGEELDQATLTLDSLGHIAQFVGEWFDLEVPAAGFEGTVVFESDVPVTVTALRTKDLLQMSSYPVGQPVK